MPTLLTDTSAHPPTPPRSSTETSTAAPTAKLQGWPTPATACRTPGNGPATDSAAPRLGHPRDIVGLGEAPGC
ncbi:hypothetical protein Asi03nite_68380 [Actinoplanes siamensis]|uniref:Uncharacterized protein n=1 Tax=Actinoplanes siamensis TaxID=1223317 RepID=A0A919NEW3_9ACTN|nr:hypothetical protein Asi03nite_68380 [Actinoplanes siamensis]